MNPCSSRNSSVSSNGSTAKPLPPGLVLSDIKPTISGSLLRTGKRLKNRWKVKDPNFYELRGSVLLVFKENPRENRDCNCPIARLRNRRGSRVSRSLSRSRTTEQAKCTNPRCSSRRKCNACRKKSAGAGGGGGGGGGGSMDLSSSIGSSSDPAKVEDWSHAYDLSAPDTEIKDEPSLSIKGRYAFRLYLGSGGLGSSSSGGLSSSSSSSGGGGGAGLSSHHRSGGRKELVLAASTEESKRAWMEALQSAINCKISTADFELKVQLGSGHFGKVFLVKPKKDFEHQHDHHQQHHQQQQQQQDTTDGNGHTRLTSPSSASSSSSSADSTTTTVSSSSSPPPSSPTEACTCYRHHKLLAMKEIRISTRHRPSFLMNERVAMATLGKHPFIISLVTAFREKEFLYLGLEFAAGGDLFEVLKRSHGQFFKPKQAAYIAAEVALALEHAHKHSIIFRDLKPENVLIDADGHIKLGDWGLAKRLQGNPQRTYTFCGTKAYIPPEVFRRDGSSFAGDFWQLGTFIYELHAGYSPFYVPQDKQRGPLGGGGRDDISARVMGGEFSFAFGRFDDAGENLIENLLEVTEEKRMTSWDDVKSSRFFRMHLGEGVTWNDVLARKLTPPIKPKDTTPPPPSSSSSLLPPAAATTTAAPAATTTTAAAAEAAEMALVANFSPEFTKALARWGPNDPFRLTPGCVQTTLRDEGLYTDELIGFTYCRGRQSGVVEVEEEARAPSPNPNPADLQVEVEKSGGGGGGEDAIGTTSLSPPTTHRSGDSGGSVVSSRSGSSDGEGSADTDTEQRHFSD